MEVLGMFYFYLLTQHHSGKQLHTKQKQLHLIERTAKERGISLLELKAIGYWLTQQEKTLVHGEHLLVPLSKGGK